MKHIDMNIVATRRRLMRRVWYSYLLSLVTRSSFVHGFMLGASVSMFGRLTHVAAITNNLLEVPVGFIPTYALETIRGALAGGEVLTVLVTVLLVGLSVSAVVRLGSLLSHHQTSVA
jgi:Na+/H+-dicarboxylate symporter